MVETLVIQSNLKENLKTIYTVGSSNRKIEEFITLLKAYQIESLVDVRRFPTGKFDYFKKENLRSTLTSANIEYIWMGEELGGYQRGGYKTYTKTERFEFGIRKIEELVKDKNKKVILMCSERLPWRCHRRFIGMALQNRGFEVIHIIDLNRTWRPKETNG